MPGARVATETSLSGRSANAMPDHSRPGTEIHEVWATAGYGLIEDPSRCKRIKRNFYRACRRAYNLGCTQYRGKDFWYSNIPFRIRQQLSQEIRTPAKKILPPHQQTRSAESLNVFCWNASNGLLLDEWVPWLTQTSYDVAILQETGWRFTNQWVSGDWYMLHSHGHRATVLCMVRRRLLRPDQLAWAELCPGRLIHVRLHLTRIHDVLCVYQHSWSSLKDRQTLLQDRMKVFEAIKQCVRHVPKSHMLLLAGDCNTPLTADAPHVHSTDPKYGQATQCDKHDFQTMIRDLDLVAVHSQNHWTPTF